MSKGKNRNRGNRQAGPPGVPPDVSAQFRDRIARSRAKAAPGGLPPGAVELKDQEMIALAGMLQHVRGELSEIFTKTGECFNMLNFCKDELHGHAVRRQAEIESEQTQAEDAGGFLFECKPCGKRQPMPDDWKPSEDETPACPVCGWVYEEEGSPIPDKEAAVELEAAAQANIGAVPAGGDAVAASEPSGDGRGELAVVPGVAEPASGAVSPGGSGDLEEAAEEGARPTDA